MTWHARKIDRRVAIVGAAICTIGLSLGQLEVEAQETGVAPTDAAAPTAAVSEEAPAIDEEEPDAPLEGALSPEELQALVAPVALYPDLVLVLALQASLAPLDIVQADRFLAQYDEDPSLEPDPGWDESVIGLLNYPTVVRTMSADLEWTDTLGTAVIDQLEGVQDAIQDFRAFMRAIGALESNEQVTIIAEGDIIRIEPTDENAVFIPQYDPDALLAALYSTDVAPEAAAPEDEAMASEEVVESDEATETEEEFVEEEGAFVEAAPVEGTAPVAEAVPATAPAYYPAVAPPPVTYSDPSPSWLGTAATFAGGAVVGGLVGWAIADDDDDDDGDGDYSRGNIDIEDSTITINRGSDGDELDDLQRRVQDERLDREARQQAQREQAKLKVENERLKREARQKEQRQEAKRQLEQRYPEKQQRTAAAGGGAKGKVSGLAASGSKQRAAVGRESAGGRQLAATVDQAKVTADPRRRTATQGESVKTGGKTVRAGDRKEPQVASAFGGSTKSTSEARRESDRGLKSRSRAQTELKPNRSRSGSSAFAQQRGGKAQTSGNRGRKSRGR
jgi:hypothetical protein